VRGQIFRTTTVSYLAYDRDTCSRIWYHKLALNKAVLYSVHVSGISKKLAEKSMIHAQET